MADQNIPNLEGQNNCSHSNESLKLHSKMFFSKLRTLTKYSDIISHFVENLYELTKANIIYLDYHRTHSLLSISHYKGNLEFEYKIGITCMPNEAEKILFKNKLPNLDKIKGLTTYKTIPIQYDNNLHGIVILDGIKNLQASGLSYQLSCQYAAHFASFLHAFKLVALNKKIIDPATGAYSKKYFYKTLYETFDKSKKLSLVSICLSNIKSIDQINHRIYRMREKEFVILFRKNLTDTASLAEKIRRSLLVRGSKASIGVSAYPETCHDADSLLYTAQSAMLAVKNKYRVCTAKPMGKEINL